jgi:hypothetical protein
MYVSPQALTNSGSCPSRIPISMANYQPGTNQRKENVRWLLRVEVGDYVPTDMKRMMRYWETSFFQYRWNLFPAMWSFAPENLRSRSPDTEKCESGKRWSGAKNASRPMSMVPWPTPNLRTCEFGHRFASTAVRAISCAISPHDAQLQIWGLSCPKFLRFSGTDFETAVLSRYKIKRGKGGPDYSGLLGHFSKALFRYRSLTALAYKLYELLLTLANS